MAQVLQAPLDFSHEFGDFNGFVKAFDQYVIDLRAEASKARLGPSPFVGHVLSFGVADGRAQYMVAGVRNQEVILWHLPVGDAYRAHRLIEKGIDLEYLQETIKLTA